ncbi:MAG: DUF805 domain-containing protein [Bacteroidales bacterium]|jgi:uncharacterized membrane protein YhaH (DUF805 family)|nr:DUF805 domain-containing protein [Bacteroidales bacterium]
MNEYFLDVIKNHYIDFEGRARRKQYWMYTLYNIIINFGIILIAVILFLATKADAIISIASIIIRIIGLALLLPSLGLTVRRLHDIGKSPWWILIIFIPLVGSIIFLVFLCTDSERGTNEYGPNPKGIN